MSITIKDIANELGLNFSTVSRALNNKPSVKEETRKLVIETANIMGYHPNIIARELVSRTTKNINTIIPKLRNSSDKQMIKKLKYKTRKMEEELQRKDQALAEMATLLKLKKCSSTGRDKENILILPNTDYKSHLEHITSILTSVEV